MTQQRSLESLMEDLAADTGFETAIGAHLLPYWSALGSHLAVLPISESRPVLLRIVDIASEEQLPMVGVVLLEPVLQKDWQDLMPELERDARDHPRLREALEGVSLSDVPDEVDEALARVTAGDGV